MRTKVGGVRSGQNALLAFGVGVLAVLAIVFGRAPAPTGVTGAPSNARHKLRLGYFPNVTHAPGIIGVADGSFQRALGSDVALEPIAFNAGPEEMEALSANAIDIGYVGPGPAINTFIKSNGKKLRVIAGACSGGAALVARDGADIAAVKDLAGKRVAVPQLGGTQDISLRHFLAVEKLAPKERGGSVEILPIKNPDILTLFLRGQLDAAWVPEPWASRLVKEAKAKFIVDERDLWPGRKFTSTVVVVRTDFLKERPDDVERFLQAHNAEVAWIGAHPDDAQSTVNRELKRLTGKPLAPDVMKSAWSRVTFTADPDKTSLQAMANAAADAGYLPTGGVKVDDLVTEVR